MLRREKQGKKEKKMRSRKIGRGFNDALKAPGRWGNEGKRARIGREGKKKKK